MKPLDIFLATAPGFEDTLAQEALALGFTGATAVPGGVQFAGHWPAIWRANLLLRGATRVLARIGRFRAFHLNELEQKAAEIRWQDTFRTDLPLKIEVTTRASKIYHEKAAAERIATALTRSCGITVQPEAPITLRLRIDSNLCTFSVDTTGDPLHIRNHKAFVGKAPMRETLAALMLRHCGYTGDEPVLDPMCGSGTFPIEAAEIARGLAPGRSRGFAFEHLATFQPERWETVKAAVQPNQTDLHFFGSDRDAGATKGAAANATRAEVADLITFKTHAISDLQRPEGPPGLVMVNPPYGGRIGGKGQLYALYGSLGKTLMANFSGWRVGLVTSEPALAKATGLPLKKPGLTFPHGGLRVTLFQTDPLR